MRIQDIRFHGENGQGLLTAAVCPAHSGVDSTRVWFRFPAAKRPPNPGDVMLSAFLVPSMQAGEDLDIAAQVSTRLMAAVPGIQDILLNWYPAFRRSRVHAMAGVEVLSAQGGTAAFFSAGVDSIYTAIDPALEVDRLVLVHGFENPEHRQDLLRTTLSAVEPVARMLNKELIVVSTNLRSVADRSRPRWGKRFNGPFFGFCWMGSFLAALGHCMQMQYRRFVIPASLRLDALYPYGSHPHLDPLWSSQGLEIIHHGAGAGRLEKIRSIAAHNPEIAEWFQVCESNPPGQINCGDCDKCLRTRLALRLAGIKEPTPAFPRPPKWSRWPLIADRNRWQSEYADLLQWCRDGDEPEAVSALEAILKPQPGWRDLYPGVRRRVKSVAWRWAPSLVERMRGRRRRGW